MTPRPFTVDLTLQPAKDDDFPYIYGLCDLTMRSYVEADLGDCFAQIARPTLENLLRRGVFSMIHCDDALVGVIAYERHETHIQLEEMYIEPARQNRGLGTRVMEMLMSQSRSHCLPIRLHVLSSNPARRFYERLGFQVTRSRIEVHFMEFTPTGALSDV